MDESPQQEPRKGGRPRSTDPSSVVTTRLPSSAYDRLIRQAAARDVSVSRMVRDLLTLKLR